MKCLHLRVLLASALLAGSLAWAAPGPVPAKVRPVTWAHDVAPILFQNCAQCHRPGGPGPFSLLSAADAQRRGRQIAQVTASRYMPPWLPEPDSGPFVGARRLSARQIAVLRQWAAEGAPRGPASPSPPPPRFMGEWQNGMPDRIVTMTRSYTLPGETTSPYRCFVLPSASAGEEWLRAIEFHPGNRVVRHATLYADPTGEARRLEQGSGSVGYAAPEAGLGPDAEELAEWNVGAATFTLPAGTAERLPAGSDLVLMLRFATDGQPETVRPQVGLFYAPPPQNSPAPLTLGSRDLILDPGQKATVTDSFTLPVATRLLRVTPHGHPVGRTLQVTAVPPTGPVRDLLRIDDWNAEWGDSYQFTTPPVLPPGTRVTIRWTADNSRDNPRNPSTSPMTVMPGLLFLDDMAAVRLLLLSVNPTDAPALKAAVDAPRPAPVVQTTRPDRHG